MPNWRTLYSRILGRGSSRLFSFQAPLKSSLVLDRGTGSPTFTRASVATVVDHEGLVKNVLSGEARFTGARRVSNLLVSGTETATNWLGNTGVTKSDLGSGVIQFVYDGSGIAGAYRFYLPEATPVLTIGNTTSMSIDIQADSPVAIILNVMGQFSNINVTTAWQRISANATANTTTPSIEIDAATASNATFTIRVRRPQIENVQGQSNQNPSEYVSVGVLSAPYHGAGVDGVKYFQTQNGNTVASNVVTETTGAAIADSTLKGYLAEGERTQLFATADIRDMTTAAWTLGATMTRARTSVGADGAANSATRLTGGAVAATNTCYSTFVAAASSRTYSALVKRVTGTGPVRIVQTGTETDISSLINSTTYTQVELNASVLNVAVGFKIDTNGDAIDVDFNQFEAGAFASSRIAVTGARAEDVLTFPTASNFSDTAGTSYAEFLMPTIGQYCLVGTPTGATTNMGTAGAVSGFQNFDGSNNCNGPAGTPPANTIIKAALKWSGANQIVAVGGTLGASASYDGAYTLGADMSIGRGNGSIPFFGNIRNVRIAQSAFADTTLQAITA